MLTKNPIIQFPVLSVPVKFNRFPSSPFFYVSLHHRCSSSKSVLYWNPLSGKKIRVCRRLGLMEDKIIRISALGSGDGEGKNVSVFEQENLVDGSPQIRHSFSSSNLDATLNRLFCAIKCNLCHEPEVSHGNNLSTRKSKWLVAAVFGAVILYRHDAEALWAGLGSIINSALSVILKRILNQERPFSNLRSDPGMPSSHAQSIFYTVVFIIISMVEGLGVNELTLIFATASLMFGSYLSWLRVSQQLHTISQVTVGAVLGSCFSLLWLWSWDAIVLDAFNSSLWVRLSILLGSAILGLGFLSYVIRNWFSDER